MEEKREMLSERAALAHIANCFRQGISPIPRTAFCMDHFSWRPEERSLKLLAYYPLDQDIHNCEAFHCIGGYVRELTGIEAWGRAFDGRPMGEVKLCHPPKGIRWKDITPLKAAQAIENFLATENPLWKTVLPAPGGEDDL